MNNLLIDKYQYNISVLFHKWIIKKPLKINNNKNCTFINARKFVYLV